MSYYTTLIPVRSSSIRAVDYQDGALFVQFHASDIIYSHHGVSYSVFLEFMRAHSMGAYYNRRIRGKYN